MRIVLISGHDGASDRKTGFHFWAEILSKRGIDADFVTVGSSWISLLKKGGKQLKPPFNKWVPMGERLRKFTWMPPLHPLYLGNKYLNMLSWPVFALYPYLMPPALLKSMREADTFIIENGAGQMLVPRLARLNPNAKFIFNSSDRPSVVKFHPIVVRSEKTMLPYLHAIRLNAASMAKDFPEGTETHYIPQAIDKTLFDADLPNPYTKPKNAINVGDMIFDPVAIEVMAGNFPDWTFHLFGKGAKITKPMENVVEHGEVPFGKLVPYLKHADIGLSPYQNTEKAAYLGQSSLKNVQYTYCQLPIVAPDIAAGSRPHILSYTSSEDEQSVVAAFEKAITYDRSSIDKNVIPSWEDVIDRMRRIAEENKAKCKTHVVFLLTQMQGVKCGVGDYTLRLAESICAQGMDASVEFMNTWSFKNVIDIALKYKGRRDIIFHVQYPSLGMGDSPAPAFLPLLLAPHPLYITLHEYSIFNVLRKSIFLIPAMLSKKILFTNEYEKDEFKAYYPLAARKLDVIPIGENIPVVPLPDKQKPRRPRIIYFGQISADKGLELYLETVRLLRANDVPADTAIIGSIVDEEAPITQAVRRGVRDDGIELCLNYTPDKVSEELQKSTIALLAFPDGITEKRGSALACLKHGNILITTHTRKTPDWLRKSTAHIKTPEEAAALISAIIDGKTPQIIDTEALVAPMAIREWPNIAARHVAIYKGPIKA